MLVSKTRGLAAAFFACAMLAAFPLVATQAEAASDVPLLVTARGAWSASVTYALDDLVTSRGSTWRSKHANNKGKVPGSTSPSTAADWEAFAVGFNPLGAWTTTHKYQINDLVSRGGATWRAKNTNLNKPPESNAANWIKFAAKGDTGPRGLPGSTAVTDGSTSAPSFKFTSSPDTGIFSPGGGKIALAENGALFLHDTGNFNLALGLGALRNSTGSSNTALGFNALFFNSTGASNTAVGALAMQVNTTGSRNTALGDLALNSNEAGNDNTAVGYQALLVNTASDNTAFGRDALASNNDGEANTAVGKRALQANVTGFYNTAVGSNALLLNDIGEANTSVGRGALNRNTGGSDNAAVGHDALAFNTTGVDNIAVGTEALFINQTGSHNVAIGGDAGSHPTNPSNSIFIGNDGLAADTSTIKIGTQGTQTTAFIAGVFGAATGVDAVGVVIDSTGKLGTAVSSRRYKQDIQPISAMSDMLARLRPVSFRYRKPYADGSKPIQYGLIAEEVAEVFPYLAVFNEKGQPETVKYHLLPTFLLEGFQEQQRTIAAQAEQIARQQSSIEALEERVRALDTQEERIVAMEESLRVIQARFAQPNIKIARDRQ